MDARLEAAIAEIEARRQECFGSSYDSYFRCGGNAMITDVVAIIRRHMTGPDPLIAELEALCSDAFHLEDKLIPAYAVRKAIAKHKEKP